MFDTWNCAFSALSIPCSYIRWEEIPIKTDTITVFVDACFVGPPVPEAVPIFRLSSGCHRQLFFSISIHFFSSDCILHCFYSSSSQPQPCTSSLSDHQHRSLFLGISPQVSGQLQKTQLLLLLQTNLSPFPRELRQSPAQTIPCTLPSIFRRSFTLFLE